MHRIIAAFALVAALLVLTGGAALAAPQCPLAAQVQDFVGTYASDTHDLGVHVYPCGGLLVEWEGTAGSRSAAYGVVDRTDDGIIASALPESRYQYDNRSAIGLKAAERGFVQLMTIERDGRDLHVWRLRKVSNIP